MNNQLNKYVERKTVFTFRVAVKKCKRKDKLKQHEAKTLVIICTQDPLMNTNISRNLKKNNNLPQNIC